MSKIKITTLCENRTPGFGLLGEHGLSMLLETGGKRILFDTGAGLTLAANAHRLGIDLGALNMVVLSHGHYDHTGGLRTLSDKNNSLLVYAHPDIFIDKYHIREGKERKYIGPSWARDYLQNSGVQFQLEQGPVDLGNGVIITGQIPRTEESEKSESHFLQKTNQGLFVEDPINDDQALVVESSGGAIVLLGCAHAGLINTLRYVSDLTGKGRIRAVLGGTHLQDVSERRLTYTMEATA